MKQKTKQIIAAALAVAIGGSIVIGSLSVLIINFMN